jgi:hypothetical protein
MIKSLDHKKIKPLYKKLLKRLINNTSKHTTTNNNNNNNQYRAFHKIISNHQFLVMIPKISKAQ